ncbi:hypothetical protein [Liquorilactobacillus satsumensis]|uniref:hypothetical protein n=1 Tax=Liquorilactobacillus satsumensis TaxID=259059 RepID=UPI0039E78E99
MIIELGTGKIVYEVVITIERNSKGQFIRGNSLQDLAGKRFGRLVALKLSSKKVGRKTFWDCKCDCGKSKTVRTDILKSGKTLSCGCLKKEQDKINLPNGQGRVKHGFSKTRIYNVWKSMHRRCENSEDSEYLNYGGRGIKVCREWSDINEFVEWSYFHGYQSGLTIDRIDVNGNYEPSNCRWADLEMQANNKRNNVFIEYKGKSQTISQWAKEFEVDRYLIADRYKRGIKPPRLFQKKLTPITAHLITYKGKTKTIAEWAKEIGIKPKTLAERARRDIKQPKLFFPGSLNEYRNKKIPR